jgi:Putative glucoamylase/Protein of unknown function (DUF3131)/RTX calcium-binding nonapeptide repeat (4 copies)
MRGLGVVLASIAFGLAAQPAVAGDRELERYAKGTWASFAAMTDEETGLPTDKLEADGTRNVQTSITNIGSYLWSAVVAEELGIIRRRELVDRLRTTIGTLERMERHEPSGQYWNWYDHTTGAKLTVWPPTGQPETPRLSSVDNGWLATGLKVVASRVPELSRRARALYDSMNFGFFYRPAVNRIVFHVPETGNEACCYDTFVSESRIASYIGVAKGEIPPQVAFGTFRSWPDSCASAWTETRPVGFMRTYYGVSVHDGALPYAGMQVTPSWGGSMFEALMPALFLPEEEWAPGSWGVNHPLTVDAQIHHGLVEAGYGYWGFSPANVPEGGYRTYGVDGIGSDSGGYPSNNDSTTIDHGWPGCPDREPKPDPPPSAYTNGVVTPHAAFLGLRYRPGEAVANLRRLERDFPGLYTPLGFRDSVNVDSGVVSSSYLSLDQGMVRAALGNALERDMMRKAFATRDVERELRPVIGVEEFASSPRPCTIVGTPGRDRLRGTSRGDVMCGLGGDDEIDGRDGDDVLYGDAGDDELEGDDDDDTLYGGEGDDELEAGDGTDVASGGPGDDRFRGGRSDHYEPGE